MKRSLFIFSLFAAILFVSCTKKETHFLKNENYRNQVLAQFEKRKTEAAKRNEALFSVLQKEDLTLEQKEALEFLYAYMPLCDLADYDGEFFLKQVDAAFRARDYFPWGKTVPDDIFRHFVLVYRINNESLDTARLVFFEELKDRVKNLSMTEAVLEVNHWCHEKVCYRGTDGRTSAPLALMQTSWGRCGEESTFTTAALRAVGIPARQCYTPRWVHTDDNHAWVEAWVDGKWHFIGACEPEPELDIAWFAAPAKRAMMVHTNVFGLYTGPEEKNLETPLYSKINLLENYAETRPVKVLVVDENNRPVEGAKVQFMVYNYAEFYPISTNTTDKEGKTSILSGKGDLMIWASLNDKYGYNKSNIEDELTTVKLDRRPGTEYEEQIVMNVPSGQAVKSLSSEAIAKNTIRLTSEDSIRNAYMATFITEEETKKLAEKLDLSEKVGFKKQGFLTSTKLWKYLNLAQGNWREIKSFIEENYKDNLFLIDDFLATLTEKDLRDTPAKVLNEYYRQEEKWYARQYEAATKGDTTKIIMIDYFFGQYPTVANTLSPRIEIELIRPFPEVPAFKRGEEAAKYVRDNVQLNDAENYYNCRITPNGVYELGIADKISRNIFFVALCRRNGIQARLEPATGKPQYYDSWKKDRWDIDKWTDVSFGDDETTVNLPKGKITLKNAAENMVKPGYYSHYTLAYFKDGEFRTLDLEDSPAVANFPYTLDLDEGYYRLMIGSRANDGSVTTYTKHFELKGNTAQTLEIKMPQIEAKLFVKGIVDMNSVVVRKDRSKASLKELSNGKGLMLCFVDPGKEPSKHILQDLPAVRQALEDWKGGVLFVTPSGKVSKGFDESVFKGLPEQTQWCVDDDLLKAAAGALKIDLGDNFPLTLYLSDNGGILYSLAGYKIGTGEDILKIIALEKKTK